MFILIVVERLVGAVREAGKTGLLEGLKIGNNEIEVIMFQFADNTTLISKDNVQNIKSILRRFLLASGLELTFLRALQVGYRLIRDKSAKVLKKKRNHNRIVFLNGLLDKVRNKLSK